jgi:hypothetical protein
MDIRARDRRDAGDAPLRREGFDLSRVALEEFDGSVRIINQ